MTFNLALPLWLRRSARAHASPSRTLELVAGQRCDVALAAGDGLRVAAGAVLLRRPARWLGETLVTPTELVLREGDAWTSVEREHVILVATTASRLSRR